MLQLKGIKKDYVAGDMTVRALKGIDLCFRDEEFVSILGPSGCGKTTLLNIIGGLDRYTDGDLLVDGISAKNYTDRDWDTYRNHRIGFVFQSYNLIPHQTILENVELALSISGVDKDERTTRAKEALDKVGLKGLYGKKPNQLSGGQCQRVAIARALVNDPEILLADEPTGALDTTTSVQIMDLIKEISSECLVIMVTHNPELAEKYSSRIIRLLDGEVQSDSAPYDGKPEKQEQKREKRKKPTKKSKLSLSSTFRLSARNLRSKFKRTFLVCLAGAIGIIGVASVLSVSTGVRGYISDMQDDMLTGNPITIATESLDLSSIMSNVNDQTKNDAIKNSFENGYINVDSTIDYLVSRGGGIESAKISNDITADYLAYVKAMPKEYYSAISVYNGIDITYGLYTDYGFEGYDQSQKVSLFAAQEIYTAMLNQTEYKEYSQYISMLSDTFAQAPDNADFILSQYDVIGGSKIATEENEIMIVVNNDYEISDLLLARLGYYTQEQFINLLSKSVGDDAYDPTLDKTKFSYDELLGKTFTWYPNDVIYKKNDSASPLSAVKPFTYEAYAQNDWTNGKELKVTAILKQKEGLSYGCLQSGFYYSSAFAEYATRANIESEIVKYLNEKELTEISGYDNNGVKSGITFSYSFNYNGVSYGPQDGLVGSSGMSGMFSQMMGSSITPYTLSLREIGGSALPNEIRIYPTNFDYKDNVTSYLKEWNSDKALVVDGKTIQASEREDVTYADNLSIVIGLVNGMIDVITTALVAFTALSLVVSTVMIAIITYVSVIERIKEIGVIRSLGGRKSDVSRLFNVETFIIGGISGIIGIGVTYLITAIVNAIVGKAIGITTLATLTLPTAAIMILISVALTMIAGIIPARLAAKKDPVEALRSE